MRNGSDDYRSQGQRRKLVELLRNKGISDQRVLQAIGSIPRHLFIDDTALHAAAYEDIPFPIGCGQTISQPYTVAYQTELLQVTKGMKVLEIGTGSGYQTAVLATMGARVFSIERHRPLHIRSRKRLEELGLRARAYYGDGYKGLTAHAPFDRILVTCGAPHLPQALVDQLAPAGRLVIPVGEGDVQRMLLVTKNAQGIVHQEDKGSFRFVPMLGEKENG
ncbi:MAG: protein-L-isoaspartate(D-aspartate) O-methyltransferase [Flavobacteriales bacterium]|nr:protein-L-isoaspartate(D-aspartate) O-methyltransferase [Flavobacteriales bacterium]MCB9168624.1 protein-L-isoaspartate(D-aspartate) O-methyltransferase [Flavobacteriales bacterium]